MLIAGLVMAVGLFMQEVLPPDLPSMQPLPYAYGCLQRQMPQFQGYVADLMDELGPMAGEATSCPMVANNGSYGQETSTGLAYFNGSTHTAMWASEMGDNMRFAWVQVSYPPNARWSVIAWNTIDSEPPPWAVQAPDDWRASGIDLPDGGHWEYPTIVVAPPGCQQFHGNFADLYAVVGPKVMGKPTACEEPAPLSNGPDTSQFTSQGIAYRVSGTGITMFTRHVDVVHDVRYALTPNGVRMWLVREGETPQQGVPDNANFWPYR
jgi:hypothetical protein